MKKIFCILICLLTLALCASALADANIQQAFPDERFREIARRADINGDGQLSRAEVSQVTFINCAGMGITSLKGIENFTSLYGLVCSDNRLNSLDLSRNPSLRILFCNGNQLSSIRSTGSLQMLNCKGNRLASLNVSGTSLTYVDCSGNPITDLNVTGTKFADLVRGESRLTGDRNNHWAGLGQMFLAVDPAVVVTAGDFVSKPNDSVEPTTEPTTEPTNKPTPAPTNPDNLATQTDLTPVPTATPTPEPTPTPTPAPNTTTKDGVKYKLSAKNKTATAIGPKKTSAKTITIPATIEVKGTTYKVTAIKAGAFKKMSKLTEVYIGKNVNSIGKNAFYGCKKLTKITIRSTKLKKSNVGDNAFKGVPDNVCVNVPNDYVKAYKKWLTKKGIPKKAKIK